MKTANRSTYRATTAAAKPSSSRSALAPRGVSSLPPEVKAEGRKSKTARPPVVAKPDAVKTLFDAEPIPSVASPKAVTAKKVKAAKTDSSKHSQEPVPSLPATTATASVSASPTASVSASPTASVSVKKRRAPSDLALQYGEREAKREAATPVETTPARRPRRDAAARAKLKSLMTPDEALLSRLARVETVSTAAPVVTLEGVEDKPLRRSRVQETSCGKCGAASKFSTPATLCARCGAILVKA